MHTMTYPITGTLCRTVRKRDGATRFYANGCRIDADDYDGAQFWASVDAARTTESRTHWRHWRCVRPQRGRP